MGESELATPRRNGAKMKAVQIGVETRAKGFLGRLFKFVEGGLYTYRIILSNVGDEDAGSKAPQKDPRDATLWAIEFVWRFPSGQGNVHRFLVPDSLAPNVIYEFPGVDHQVLSSGYAMLHLQLLWLSGGLGLTVLDVRGQSAPLDAPIQNPIIPELGKRVFKIALEPAFASFRAKSRGEMYQSILITIALAAFLVNLVVGILNLLK